MTADIAELYWQDYTRKSRAIATIVKRNKILNKAEYILIQSYVDEIYDESSKEAEVEQLNNLLIDFK